MILELLISQYKEDETIAKAMLDSIAIQQSIDFNDINVIIANDGSDVILSEEFLNSYPYKITYYKPEHLGMSEIRNFLLDHATADYIMFCDIDDMFYTSNAIWFILELIKNKKFDCYYPHYMKELKFENGDIMYHPNYDCAVHGKVIRRQLIIDNNIRWQKDLLTHDSRYFLALCECYAEKDKMIYDKNNIHYMWRFNKKSTTRSDCDYFLQTFDYLTLSIMHLTNELLRRGMPEKAEQTFVTFTYLIYYYYNCEEWQKEENQDLVKSGLKGFALAYKKFGSFVETCPLDKYKRTILANRNEIAKIQASPYIEKITFEDWKKMIIELAKTEEKV